MNAASARPVVVFDGECNLCNRAVQFILDHDRRGRVMLCASQSAAGRALLAGLPPLTTAASETLLLVEDGRVRDRSAAVLGIARVLGLPWSLLRVFALVPRPLRDALYDHVARNRLRWFGRRATCRLPRPGEMDRFLT